MAKAVGSQNASPDFFITSAEMGEMD
jgi:hypothetical protein